MLFLNRNISTSVNNIIYLYSFVAVIKNILYFKEKNKAIKLDEDAYLNKNDYLQFLNENKKINLQLDS